MSVKCPVQAFCDPWVFIFFLIRLKFLLLSCDIHVAYLLSVGSSWHIMHLLHQEGHHVAQYVCKSWQSIQWFTILNFSSFEIFNWCEWVYNLDNLSSFFLISKYTLVGWMVVSKSKSCSQPLKGTSKYKFCTSMV